jgi:hypothetical protein
MLRLGKSESHFSVVSLENRENEFHRIFRIPARDQWNPNATGVQSDMRFGTVLPGLDATPLYRCDEVLRVQPFVAKERWLDSCLADNMVLNRTVSMSK